MKLSVIIVAAGSSRRMGFDKLEAALDGESVLARSMMAGWLMAGWLMAG